MMNSYAPEVLVVAGQEEARRRLAEVVAAAGALPITMANVGELPSGLLPQGLIVAMVVEGEEGQLDTLAARLETRAQLVAILSPVDLKRMARALALDKCNHVLADDAQGMTWLAAAVRKFASGELFGIEKYVPAGTEIMLTRLRDYQGRTRAIDEVVKYAEEQGVRSRIRTQIGQVCEELLMNALYDAPVDEHGNLLFGDVELKERLARMSPRPVSIRHAATETHFVVCVRDRFGRLDKKTILRYLEKCLHSASQIDRKTHGAGLGLYIVMNLANQLIVSVAPGMTTEVVCAFERKGSRPGLQGFSMFVHPGEV